MNSKLVNRIGLRYNTLKYILSETSKRADGYLEEAIKEQERLYQENPSHIGPLSYKGEMFGLAVVSLIQAYLSVVRERTLDNKQLVSYQSLLNNDVSNDGNHMPFYGLHYNQCRK